MSSTGRCQRQCLHDTPLSYSDPGRTGFVKSTSGSQEPSINNRSPERMCQESRGFRLSRTECSTGGACGTWGPDSDRIRSESWLRSSAVTTEISGGCAEVPLRENANDPDCHGASGSQGKAIDFEILHFLHRSCFHRFCGSVQIICSLPRRGSMLILVISRCRGHLGIPGRDSGGFPPERRNGPPSSSVLLGWDYGQSASDASAECKPACRHHSD